jgi:hypothetical protein
MKRSNYEHNREIIKHGGILMIDPLTVRQFLRDLEAISRKYKLALGTGSLTISEGISFYSYMMPESASEPLPFIRAIVIGEIA